MKTSDLISKIRKGGESETVKSWIDEFKYGEVLRVFQGLAKCGPEHIKLLEIQAEAKVICNMLSVLDDEILLAQDAEIRLKTIAKKQDLPR